MKEAWHIRRLESQSAVLHHGTGFAIVLEHIQIVTFLQEGSVGMPQSYKYTRKYEV